MIRIDSIAVRGVAVLACLWLASCGGGDAGGSGSPGTLSLSTYALSFFTASAASTPPAQQVGATISGVADNVDVYLRVVITGTAVTDVANIQLTDDTSGNGTVIPASAASLGPGIHTSTITVTACTTSTACTSGIIGQPRTINVTYTVADIAATPASPQISVTDQSAPSDFSTTLTVRSGTPWTATSFSPYVTVSPASSSASSTQVTLTLNAAAVQQMQVPAGVTQASISFVNGPAATMVTLALNNNFSQIIAAMPHVQPAGQVGQVLLRGNNLTLTSVGQVRLGATAATSFVPESAQVLRVTYPALPAGTYPVSYTDLANTVVPRSTANVVMVDPLVTAASALAYPADGRTRSVAELHYDAERSALVLIVQYPPLSGGGEAATEVLRYIYNGSWSAASVRPMSYLSSLALRNDGAGWMAARLTGLGTTNAIQKCTADFSSCIDEVNVSVNTIRWKQIGMTNDNQPFVLAVAQPDSTAPGTLLRYSTADRTLSLFASGVLRDGVVAVSRDGQRLVFGSGATNSGAALPLQAMSTGATSLTPVTAVSATVSRLAMGRSSPLALMNSRRVIDTLTMTEVGALPTTTLGGVLNDAATRAYTFDANGKIRTYDLSAVPSAGVYPEVGTGIVPAGDPGAGANGADLRMTLSHDGRTLFLAGSARAVVQPLP